MFQNTLSVHFFVSHNIRKPNVKPTTKQQQKTKKNKKKKRIINWYTRCAVSHCRQQIVLIKSQNGNNNNNSINNISFRTENESFFVWCVHVYFYVILFWCYSRFRFVYTRILIIEHMRRWFTSRLQINAFRFMRCTVKMHALMASWTDVYLHVLTNVFL